MSFSERILQLEESDIIINQLKLLFSQADLHLTKNEVLKFLRNHSDYSALRTLFYSVVWLGDNTNKERDFPSKDTISDFIQLTEATYCTTFVSEERDLVNPSYGGVLNPNIELLHVRAFHETLENQDPNEVRG